MLLIGAGMYLLAALCEVLVRLRSGDEYEQYVLLTRLTGPYWAAYWGAVLCKGGLPQVLWRKKLRHSVGVAVALAPCLLVDAWLPLLYSRLHHDYLPSSWGMLPGYRPLAVAGAGYVAVVGAAWLLYRGGRAFAAAARRLS